jgi:hypothetical protein
MDAKIRLDQLEELIGSKCANCRKVAVELQYCSRCKGAMYCGIHCQKLHWKAGHKMDCIDGTGQKKRCIVHTVVFIFREHYILH